MTEKHIDFFSGKLFFKLNPDEIKRFLLHEGLLDAEKDYLAGIISTPISFDKEITCLLQEIGINVSFRNN